MHISLTSYFSDVKLLLKLKLDCERGLGPIICTKVLNVVRGFSKKGPRELTNTLESPKHNPEVSWIW